MATSPLAPVERSLLQYISTSPVRPELVEGLASDAWASTGSARTESRLTEQHWSLLRGDCGNPCRARHCKSRRVRARTTATIPRRGNEIATSRAATPLIDHLPARTARTDHCTIAAGAISRQRPQLQEFETGKALEVGVERNQPVTAGHRQSGEVSVGPQPMQESGCAG